MRLLPHEAGIVWLEQPARLPYVRQRVIVTRTRRQRPRWPWSSRLVGYTVLQPGAPTCGWPGRFARRVFYLAPHDPYPPGLHRWPCQAVNPREETV